MSIRSYRFMAPLSAAARCSSPSSARTAGADPNVLSVAGHPLCEWLAPPIPEGEVGLTTAVYLDDRALRSTVEVVEALYGEGRLRAVFLRDLGLLSSLAGLSGVELVWDRWAWGRDGVISEAMLRWLASNGVSGIEVRAERVDSQLTSLVGECGLTGIAYRSPVTMRSFSPRCYTERLGCQECGGQVLCGAEPHRLRAGAESLDATGHVLLAVEPAVAAEVDPWWKLSWDATA